MRARSRAPRWFTSSKPLIGVGVPLSRRDGKRVAGALSIDLSRALLLFPRRLARAANPITGVTKNAYVNYSGDALPRPRPGRLPSDVLRGNHRDGRCCT